MDHRTFQTDAQGLETGYGGAETVRYTRPVSSSPQGLGRFITLEGPEGSGKTHQAARLAGHLTTRGFEVVLTREPGGTVLGDRLYELLMATGEEIDPVSDALLFNAARAQHVSKVIRPALAAGRVVVSARFADSTLGYQGYGEGVDLGTLRRIIDIATGSLVPDRTILLDLAAEIGLERKTPETITRFEASYDLPYHRRVRDGFLELAADDPARWTVIDANRPSDDVFDDVLAATLDVLGRGREEAGPSAARAGGEPPTHAARMHG